MDDKETIPGFLLSRALMDAFKKSQGVRDYIRRLCHNNKTRIKDFFANPAKNSDFLGNDFLSKVKVHLKSQEDQLAYPNYNLADLLSLRRLQCQSWEESVRRTGLIQLELCPPYQTAVEALSHKLGQFLNAEDRRGELLFVYDS